MTALSALPDWAALLVAVLVVLGAGLTLVGTIGLVRFDSFYRRVHAPTLGTTLGAGCILIGSMVCFTVLQSRPVVHEILIALFLTVTTPVTLMFLVRAAYTRDRLEGNLADPNVRPEADRPARNAPRGDAETR